MTSLTACLLRAARLLEERLGHLEDQVRGGNEAAWGPYLATIGPASTLADRLAPGSRGELITTKQLAEALSITPKTLLKRKARGELKPALQRGKLIRWRGDEVVGR